MQGAEVFYKPWLFFGIVQSLGIFLFGAGVIYKFSFYKKGQKQSLYKKPDYRLMAKAFCRYVVVQKQLAKLSLLRWFIHVSIFYGFMGLLLLSAIAVVLETIVPQDSSISRYMLYGQGHNYYKAAGDLFGLVILVGLLLAFYRRYIAKDSQLYTDSTDTTALIFLLVLTVTGFLLEAVRMAILPLTPEIQYSFVGYHIAGVFRGMQGIKSLGTGLWIFHSTLNAALLVYIPHSKFLHVINSPVEIVLNASEERMRGDLYL